MTNYFMQIRKQTSQGTIIREMSRKIAQLSALANDAADSIRKLRTNTDKIKYTGGASNGTATLNGDKTDSDAIAYAGSNATLARTKGAFEIYGGGYFLTTNDVYALEGSFMGGTTGCFYQQARPARINLSDVTA